MSPLSRNTAELVSLRHAPNPDAVLLSPGLKSRTGPAGSCRRIRNRSHSHPPRTRIRSHFALSVEERDRRSFMYARGDLNPQPLAPEVTGHCTTTGILTTYVFHE